jgi:hypothetical protein
MRWQGKLKPVSTPHRKIGVFDRAEVDAMAAVREARRLEAERRRVQLPETRGSFYRLTRGDVRGAPGGRDVGT